MEIVKASRRFKDSYLYSPFLLFGQHDIKTIVIYSDSESARGSTGRHEDISVLTVLQAIVLYGNLAIDWSLNQFSAHCMRVCSDQSHSTLDTIQQLRELLIGMIAPFPNTGGAPTQAECAIGICTF